MCVSLSHLITRQEYDELRQDVLVLIQLQQSLEKKQYHLRFMQAQKVLVLVSIYSSPLCTELAGPHCDRATKGEAEAAELARLHSCEKEKAILRLLLIMTAVNVFFFFFWCSGSNRS